MYGVFTDLRFFPSSFRFDDPLVPFHLCFLAGLGAVLGGKSFQFCFHAFNPIFNLHPPRSLPHIFELSNQAPPKFKWRFNLEKHGIPSKLSRLLSTAIELCLFAGLVSCLWYFDNTFRFGSNSVRYFHHSLERSSPCFDAWHRLPKCSHNPCIPSCHTSALIPT